MEELSTDIPDGIPFQGKSCQLDSRRLEDMGEYRRCVEELFQAEVAKLPAGTEPFDQLEKNIVVELFQSHGAVVVVQLKRMYRGATLECIQVPHCLFVQITQIQQLQLLVPAKCLEGQPANVIETYHLEIGQGIRFELIEECRERLVCIRRPPLVESQIPKVLAMLGDRLAGAVRQCVAFPKDHC